MEVAQLALIHGICIRTGKAVLVLMILCQLLCLRTRLVYYQLGGAQGGGTAGTDTRHLHTHR
jgi:hypothetical protein